MSVIAYIGFVLLGLLIAGFIAAVVEGVQIIAESIDRLTAVLKNDFGIPKEFETKKDR